MVKYKVNQEVRFKVNEFVQEGTQVRKDGLLSAITAILCEHEVAHSFTVSDGSHCDLISLWYEENNKEFHMEWFEEKSIKHLEEEDEDACC